MIGYVAKDKNGALYFHKEKPTYDNDFEEWYGSPDVIDITGQFPEFYNLKYTDEPVKVEIKLEII